MFVRSGILSKFKTDASGRRQIVALRFPGEGILPRDGRAEYGIQAIVRSEVMVGKAEDFDPIVDAHPEMQRFFWRLIQRNEAIGYEWLVNCGRRDSTARVAHLLCETAVRMHAPTTGTMINPFTQQQIADITGQTSVNVNRVFADMERQGLIRRKGREIEFTDWAKCAASRASSPSYLELDRRRPEAWWARQGLNLRPHPCEGCALPLSYAPARGSREAARYSAALRAV